MKQCSASAVMISNMTPFVGRMFHEDPNQLPKERSGTFEGVSKTLHLNPKPETLSEEL